MAPAVFTPLSSDTFIKYQQYWQQLLEGASSAPGLLDPTFNTVGKRVRMVCFPAEQILWLISTAGATNIQLRFVLTSEPGNSDNFAVVLYATDDQNKRLSAYYQSTPYAASPYNGDDAEAVAGNMDDSEMMPHAAVQQWVNNWQEANSLSADMFKNSYGPLQGYTFSYNEVLNNLFATSTYDSMVLGVVLGLHEHYGPNNDGATADYTFGLALRIYNTGTITGKSAATFFDHSMPCPPGY
jgi:hypothetical protein